MKTIEYKVSYEKMISRLPGLFAYLESDEFGNMSLHKATDSLDGCWGKIVENINLPSGVSLKDILHGGETYSFRTIIDYYYQYREELGEDDEFVKFIEKAIGKITVDFEGKTEMSHEDMTIYFFQDKNGEKNIMEITMDDIGNLSEFPMDFFDQVRQDMLELMNLERKRKGMKDGEW